MTLRCAEIQVTAQELERSGYTVVDLGLLTLRDTDPRRFDMADMRVADLIGPCLFIIESQTDRSANIQPFGSYVNEPTNSRMQYNIGPARLLPVQEQIAIEVPLSDSWFPYLGLIVTPTLAPTVGNVHALAIYIRRPCQ